MIKKLLLIIVDISLVQEQAVAANPITWMRNRYNQWWADRSFKTLVKLQQRQDKDFIPALLKYVDQLEEVEAGLTPDQQIQLQHWKELASKEYRKIADRYLNRIAGEYAAMQNQIREINPNDFYRVSYLDMEVSGTAYIDLLYEITAQDISDYISQMDKIKKYLSADQIAQIDRWQATVNSMRKK